MREGIDIIVTLSVSSSLADLISASHYYTNMFFLSGKVINIKVSLRAFRTPNSVDRS